MITVKEFILMTVNNYTDLTVNEYDGNKNVRRIVMDKGKWSVSDIPDDLLNRKITSICPYYDRISLEVDVVKQ